MKPLKLQMCKTSLILADCLNRSERSDGPEQLSAHAEIWLVQVVLSQIVGLDYGPTVRLFHEAFLVGVEALALSGHCRQLLSGSSQLEFRA